MKMEGESESNSEKFTDTADTKIFVGGLAWKTRRDSLERHFKQFGEITEAVVIIDKSTGRSKGYGFVTFKDPDSAAKACEIQYPVIDGRKANCNLATCGAVKNRPTASSHAGFGQLSPIPRVGISASQLNGTSTYLHRPMPQYTNPCPIYGYPVNPQEIYAMVSVLLCTYRAKFWENGGKVLIQKNNWENAAGYKPCAVMLTNLANLVIFYVYLQNPFNLYGGKQLPTYYTIPASSSPGVYWVYNPFYAQQVKSSSSYYPKPIQDQKLPEFARFLPCPTSASLSRPDSGQYLLKRFTSC
ncbi:hypothetical protein Tsubulata_006151 [Turnera subulata]|uniref:RRM domain-containing protein n=1 Tax=Turnera subulata TaxID=218843 RepID=A0A9Q0FQH9_9ROSI|nr:hypothetical protein Tsubulata_006151 [Turnera subulata]